MSWCMDLRVDNILWKDRRRILYKTKSKKVICWQVRCLFSVTQNVVPDILSINSLWKCQTGLNNCKSFCEWDVFIKDQQARGTKINSLKDGWSTVNERLWCSDHMALNEVCTCEKCWLQFEAMWEPPQRSVPLHSLEWTDKPKWSRWKREIWDKLMCNRGTLSAERPVGSLPWDFVSNTENGRILMKLRQLNRYKLYMKAAGREKWDECSKYCHWKPVYTTSHTLCLNLSLIVSKITWKNRH